jgi:membrane protease YdiL (CAAX protease family)
VSTTAPATRPITRTGGFWSSITVFLVLTWIGSAGLAVVQPLLGLSPGLLILAQFGPTVGMLGAVTLTMTLRQSSTLNPATVSIRSIVGRIGIGVLVLAAMFAGYAALAFALGHPVKLPAAFPAPFWLLATLQLLGACGEELGWRTFLQRHLRSRWPALGSSLIVGVLWGTWHIQYYGFGLLFLATFVLTTMAVSVIFGILTENTGWWSLLVAGVLHWLLNLGILLLADFEHGGQLTVTVLAVVSVAAAVIVATTAHLRLRRQPAS